MKVKKIKKRFYFIVFAFLVSALSILLAPYGTGDDGNLTAMGYTAGILFWAGLVIGIIGYIVLRKKTDVSEIKLKMPFFSNSTAKITDSLMVIGIIGSMYCVLQKVENQVVTEIFLVIALAGIYSHFMFNSKVYQLIVNSSNTKKK